MSWPQETYLANPRIMHAHETFVDMLHGRTKFSLLDALSLVSLGVDEDGNGSENDIRTTEVYCGVTRNFYRKPRVTVVARRSITREAMQKADQTAEELIEEEERLKQKTEKKKLKKMRQKEKKRQEKEEREGAKENQTKGDIKNKKENKKSTGSSHKQCNPDCSDEKDEEDKDSISSEKVIIDSNDTLNINKKVKNKKLEDPDVSPQCSSDGSSGEDGDDYYEPEEEGEESELEELDMNSCFVSNAAATLAKRQLEKAKDKREKRDRKAGDSGKESPKPDVEQQDCKTNQEVPLAPYQNKVKAEPEKNITDPVTRSMELAFIGNQYAANGNLELAVKYFTDAIMHNPREYKLFGNRSFCFEKMEQFEKALMDANVALSMNPQWIKGLYRKGRALSGLKRFMEAMHVYKEVLALDSSCADAAQELIKVQILQLMEMGFSREQSTNAMIVHGNVEKALDALSGFQGTYIPVPKTAQQQEWVRVEKRAQSPKPGPPTGPPPGPQLQQSTPVIQPPQPRPIQPELFPVWVGCPPQILSEAFIYDLFRKVGVVHSVKVLRNKNCAFVNYIKREDCDRAIAKLHGLVIAGGCPLVVRFPDRIHPHLGVSKGAATVATDKLPDECNFWRNMGCIKNQGCQYRHVPENKGIDRRGK
ncbi:leiomodin-1 isoform X2 [Engraulis encrasicolus]|uniref:leiomodin-1 isoform X2 n=1 Tax=Engraulis encrasicolus TaxID=184585 RepID=UPI002FD4D911